LLGVLLSDLTEQETKMPSVAQARRATPLLALLLILLAVVAIIVFGDGERTAKPTDTLPVGTDSANIVELEQQLPDSGDGALVVFEGEIGPRLDRLRGLAERLGAETVTPAEDGSVAIASVPLEASNEDEGIRAVKELRAELKEQTPEGITASVTGPDATATDIDAVFDGANTRLLGATAAVVAVLLIVTYRSPVLFFIPLLVVGVADRLASVVATHLMAALDVAFSGATTSILSILVFGAGTDYALLLISRYRTELTSHESRYEAMTIALRRTAEAVLTSAATVVLGVLCLLLSLTPSTRALGAASAVGIAVASVFVLVVLPAALVSFGRWIFWPRIPRKTNSEHIANNKSSIWFKVGTFVASRPKAIAAGGFAVVTLAATGLFGISLGLDNAEAFQTKPESVKAAERLAQSFPAGLSDPVQIATRESADPVLNSIQTVDGVETAEVTAQGNGVTMIQAVLSAAPGSAEAKDAVQDIRSAVQEYPDTFVGGSEALTVDNRDSTARDLLVIIPVVTLLVMLTLGVLLRSVVAPIVLVGTVVATYAAALGASWWLFTGVFGWDGLEVNVPVIAFVFLVALGVDYNIFLVTRAREESTERGTRAGMLYALGATGGVITSAGILLAAVFTVLGLLPAVGLAQIGVVICIGVLLDTLLIRTVLVPAIALLLGDRFWWPRNLESQAETTQAATQVSSPASNAAHTA
jgi:putative drug exporter of the RND superfamily